MSEDEAEMAEIGAVITAMAASLDRALFDLTEDELVAQWFWAWDNARSADRNLYEFCSALELHGRRCRRWEERHHGHECVVERVRDKYLMPRIRELLHAMEQKP